MGKIKSIEFNSIRKLNLVEIRDRKVDNKIDLKDLNIFIGANGSGKSTVLDIIHSLKDNRKLGSLPRENNPPDSKPSSLLIKQENDESLEFNFYENYENNDINELYLDCKKKEHGVVSKEIFTINKTENLNNLNDLEIFLNSNDRKIHYLNYNDEYSLSNEKLVNVLNEYYKHLLGISEIRNYENNDLYGHIFQRVSFPFTQINSNDAIGVFLEDDLHQTNNVLIKNIPSGWKKFATIIDILEGAEDNSICVFDEPEVNLHPRFQRLIIEKLIACINEKSIQVFIATHSPTFIDYNYGGVDTSIFEMNGSRINVLDNSHLNLMELLGLKVTDISHTPGIIWVEGPADRLYIKHWLTRLSNFKEKNDYNILFYGGSVLSHFSAEEIENVNEDLISILSINKKAFIIMDNDNHYSVQRIDSYSLIDINKGKTKERLRREFLDLSESCATTNIKESYSNPFVWITDYYTIESYLPNEYLDEYFDLINNRLKTKDNIKKIDVANKYIENNGAIKVKVIRNIAKIRDVIHLWKSSNNELKLFN